MAELQFRAEGLDPERRHGLRKSSTRPALLLFIAAVIGVIAYSSGRTYVSANPTTLDFGLEPVAALSPPRSVTISNQGSERLRNPAISLMTTDFTISSNGCIATLDPGEACSMEVRFTPQAEGSHVARLELPQAHQRVILSGTAFSRELFAVSPATVDFGEQQILTDSDAQAVTVTNQSPVDLTFGIGIEQDPNRQFAIGQNDCNVLQSHQRCTIGIRFHPSAESTVSAFLMVRDSSGFAPHALRMTGVGKAPGFKHIDIQPDSLTFEGQRIRLPCP